MWGSWACSMFGAYVIYTNKEMYNKPHLTTPHGQFGAGVLLSMLFAPLAATIALSPDYGIAKTSKLVRFAHKWAGRLIVFAGWITSMFGIAAMLRLDQPNHGNELVAAAMMGPMFLLMPFLFL